MKESPYYKCKRNAILILCTSNDGETEFYRWRRSHEAPHAAYDKQSKKLLFDKAGIFTPTKTDFSKFPAIITPLSTNTLKHKKLFKTLAFVEPVGRKSMLRSIIFYFIRIIFNFIA